MGNCAPRFKTIVFKTNSKAKIIYAGKNWLRVFNYTQVIIVILFYFRNTVYLSSIKNKNLFQYLFS